MAAYQERLPGCRGFLANFFLTSSDYPPEINYLNYVRDLRLYSPTNRDIRQNLSVLVGAFYEITGTTPEGLAVLLGRYGEPLNTVLPRPPVASCDDDKRPPVDYHGTVSAFKKNLLERALDAFGNNRTHAAHALGIQRTYLLRLMRDFGINAPKRTRQRDG